MNIATKSTDAHTKNYHMVQIIILVVPGAPGRLPQIVSKTGFVLCHTVCHTVEGVREGIRAVWCQRGLVPDAVGGAAKGKQKSLLYFNLSTEGKVRQRGTDRQADG